MIPKDQTSSLRPTIDYLNISGLKYKGLPDIFKFEMFEKERRGLPKDIQSKSEILAIP